MRVQSALQIAGLGAVAALAVAAVLGKASAQDPQVTLRFGHWSPPQHPMSLYSVPDWVGDIEKQSGGSIKIQVFPAAQLGQPADYYDIGRDGVADISWANVGLQPGRFPVVQAIEMPLLYADPQAATLAFHEWYLQYAEKEMKDVKLCQTHALFPSEIHSKKEFKSLADFKGVKMRVPNSTQSRYMSTLGTVLVPVPATQARDAVEKGVADAVSFPWQSLIIFGIDSLVNYHMDVPFGGNGFELLFNKNSYNKLSAAQKKIIDDHCTPEWSARFMAPWNKQEGSGRATLANKPGHVVYPVSDQFRAELLAAAEPAKKEWAESVKKAGYDPDQVWKSLTDAMKKHKAEEKPAS
ncbi:MAG: TRAP transporter substrate-binding protein [Xanthobacteraceae bacterium]